MTLEAGGAYIIITVDLDNPTAEPDIEISGLSVWAAGNVLHHAAIHLDDGLPDCRFAAMSRGDEVRTMPAPPRKRAPRKKAD